MLSVPHRIAIVQHYQERERYIGRELEHLEIGATHGIIATRFLEIYASLWVAAWQSRRKQEVAEQTTAVQLVRRKEPRASTSAPAERGGMRASTCTSYALKRPPGVRQPLFVCHRP